MGDERDEGESLVVRRTSLAVQRGNEKMEDGVKDGTVEDGTVKDGNS